MNGWTCWVCNVLALANLMIWGATLGDMRDLDWPCWFSCVSLSRLSEFEHIFLFQFGIDFIFLPHLDRHFIRTLRSSKRTRLPMSAKRRPQGS